MSKYIIIINYNDDDFYWYNDEWKEYVCGEDFDDFVVMLDDDNHSSVSAEATWWKDAEELFELLTEDRYDDVSDYIIEYGDDYAPDKLTEAYNAYHEYLTNNQTDYEFIIQLVGILEPDIKLVESTIRGYNEWRNIVYVAGSIDEDILEDWYYGNIVVADVYYFEDGDTMEVSGEEISADPSEYSEYLLMDSPITHTEFFKISRNLKAGLAKHLGIPEDEIAEVIDNT